MTPQDIVSFMAELAPMDLAEGWDNPGLLVNSEAPVTGVLVCLDITADTIREAKELGCNMVVSHHPVIFDPLKRLHIHQPAAMLLQQGMSAVCMHTNLDAAPGGVNDTLAALMGMQNAAPFAEGMGRVGEISPVTARQLAQKASEVLQAHVKWADGGKTIRRLAVVSGAGGSLLAEAAAAGADALLTGEANHHAAHDARMMGISLLAAGHFNTEFPAMKAVADALSARFEGLKVVLSTADADPFSYI